PSEITTIDEGSATERIVQIHQRHCDRRLSHWRRICEVSGRIESKGSAVETFYDLRCANRSFCSPERGGYRPNILWPVNNRRDIDADGIFRISTMFAPAPRSPRIAAAIADHLRHTAKEGTCFGLRNSIAIIGMHRISRVHIGLETTGLNIAADKIAGAQS